MNEFPTAADPLRLYEQLLLIRAYENAIVQGSTDGRIPGTCTSVGQEAAAVGAINALTADDLILTNHRSAGHLLAHGADPGRLLAEALGLPPDKYQIAFQSRFGRTEWLQPYTAPTLSDLGKQRTERVDVICPGFASDCLETLEEIAIEGKASFLQSGGGAFHYIPCLNERDDWIHALARLATQHLQGWPTDCFPADETLINTARRARDLGARY